MVTNCDAIESITNESKPQLLTDKYKIPVGNVGKLPIGVPFIERYVRSCGKLNGGIVNDALLFADIVIRVSGKDGKYCKLLLSVIKTAEPDGNPLGKVLKGLLEQSKYDNVNGKFNWLIWFEEQSKYDIDNGKPGNAVNRLLLQ